MYGLKSVALLGVAAPAATALCSRLTATCTTREHSKYREVLRPWLKSFVPIVSPERTYKLMLDRLGHFDI